MIPEKQPVATICDSFWNHYRELIRGVSIPYQWETLNDRTQAGEKSGAVRNFKIAAGLEQGDYYGTCFQDSDLGKWLEAVAYTLEWHPDPALESLADEAIELIGKAQQPDGYINTYFTLKEPQGRFTNLRECCEHYCFGHLAEAAVAYHQATGKRRLLDILCRYADYLCDTFGPAPGQCRGYDGHPEAELALVRLYEATGERRYLELASFFIEERGAEPYYPDLEWERRGRTHHYEVNRDLRPSDDKVYDNAALPPRQESEARGHAVKTAYLLTGMAGVARHTEDQALLDACRRILSNMEKRMYITGGIGSTKHQEAFTFDYDLPNDRAYAETCAAVALVFFMRAMQQAEPKSEYAEIMERALYNGALAGMALDGRHFFYVNPLEVFPEASAKDKDLDKALPLRQPWYFCACCPPNLIRLIASLGRYIYTLREDTVYVDLFVSSETEAQLPCGLVKVRQQSGLPFAPGVSFQVDNTGHTPAALALRVPGYMKEPRLAAGGKPVEILPDKAGYVYISCSPGRTEITLDFTLAPRVMVADPRVRQDAGRCAVTLGPLVYCAEEADNGQGLAALSMHPGGSFTTEPLKLDVPGALAVTAERAWRDQPGQWQGETYQEYSESLAPTPCQIKLVPYCLWGNRNGGSPAEMSVWLRAAGVPPNEPKGVSR